MSQNIFALLNRISDSTNLGDKMRLSSHPEIKKESSTEQ